MKNLMTLIPSYEELIKDKVLKIFAIEAIAREIYEDTCRNIGEADWITYFSEIADATEYPSEFISDNAETIVECLYEYTDNVEVGEDYFSVVAYSEEREMENRIEYVYECSIGDYSEASHEAVCVLLDTIKDEGLRKDGEEYTVDMFARAVNIVHEKDWHLYAKHVDEFKKIGRCFSEFRNEREYKDGELKTTKYAEGFYICGSCGRTFFMDDTDPEVFDFTDDDGDNYCSWKCIKDYESTLNCSWNN